MGLPWPLFSFNLSFQTNINFFTANQCRKMCWDSNSQPSEHESPPITTKQILNVFFKKNGPYPASFCLFLSFSHYNFNNTNWKKCRWCAQDSNLRPQDGRHRRYHGAMAAAQQILNVCSSIIIEQLTCFYFWHLENREDAQCGIFCHFLVQTDLDRVIRFSRDELRPKLCRLTNSCSFSFARKSCKKFRWNYWYWI